MVKLATTPRGRKTTAIRQSAPSPGGAPGEALFEAYLTQACAKYQHENYDSPPGVRTKPDYRVELNQRILFCEVKDLYKRRSLPERGAFFSPYRAIRKEIHEASKQFDGYQRHACVLVLHNIDDWEFRDQPELIFAAMLGDAGFRFDVALSDVPVGDPEMRPCFLDNSKMRYEERGRTRIQNTRFSALAVLREFDIPNPVRLAELDRARNRIPKGLSAKKRMKRDIDVFLECKEPTTLGRVPCLAIYENPFAKVALHDEVLNGPYDARYRFRFTARGKQSEGRIQRVFAGDRFVAANRLLHTNSGIYNRIDRFVHALVDRFHPERVILFGSHARGTAEPESDVDMLVVFPGDGDLSEKSLEIRRRCERDFPLDLLTYSAAALRRREEMGDSFVQQALAEGKTLFP